MPPPPAKLGEIGHQELYSILHTVFPNARHIYLGDANYDLTTDAEMDRFFAYSPVPYNPYSWDDLDCEKFAIMQMAEFYKWSKGKMLFLRIIGFDDIRGIPTHGWNLYLNSGGDLRFHDPLGLAGNPDSSIAAYPLEYVQTIS